MALLSKVTIVEVPSLQPDTPQPMTGPALEVFTVGPFMDPPKIGINGFMVLLQYDNPVPVMSINPQPGYAPEHDESEPQYIHGIHHRVRDWDWSDTGRPLFVQSQPISAMLPANTAEASYVGVYRAPRRPENLTFNNTAQPGMETNTPVLNGNNSKIDELLSMQAVVSNFANYAFDHLQVRVDSFAPNGIIRPIHIWVMCGEAYMLTSSGQILKSTDIFQEDVSERGAAVDIPTGRIHPGIIEIDPIGF